jgi:hypothetical protein
VSAIKQAFNSRGLQDHGEINITKGDIYHKYHQIREINSAIRV